MTANKYGNVLTVVLVILIVAIVLGLGLLVYNYVIKPKVEDTKSAQVIVEFDKNIEEPEKNNENNNNEITDIEPIEPSQSTGVTTNKKTYYNGFVMLGYITIPKTNVKEPILDTVTPDSLNAAVAVLYPSNPELNKPGNVVIVGHNYRNGKFFSNNKNLSVGDKIKIKDASGTELVYTIYQKFQTTEQDTSFYTRDTKGKSEITLSTCTDDAKARIIILARAD